MDVVMYTRVQRLCAGLALAACVYLAACNDTARPGGPAPTAVNADAYQPTEKVSGEIRAWGSPADGGLIQQLQAGFAKHHPDVRFSNALHGPESTLAGVYTGVADMAFMARELRLPMESMAFEWALLSKPFQVEIANAGLSADRPGTQLAVFVHKDNPLIQLSLAQLRAILGVAQTPESPGIRQWGDLSLGGDWMARSIRVYGPRIDSIQALFVRRAAMGDSRKWNPDYREIDSEGPEVIAALAKDPDGMAYAPLRYGDDRVKALALAVDDAGPFYPLNPQTVMARTYPLTRVITVVTNHAPDRPLDPKVKEFLRYVLSREGQAIIAGDGSYIPLNAEVVRQQLQRLD